jgi:hypothetical protein
MACSVCGEREFCSFTVMLPKLHPGNNGWLNVCGAQA